MKTLKIDGMPGTIREIKITTTRVCEEPAPLCDAPASVRDLWQSHVTTAQWFDEQKEALVVFLLDTKLRCIGFNLVSLGTLNESTAHPREIFRPAIIAGCYAIALAHNHPSGQPDPSSADRRLTSNLREAASILQVNLIDHVIVGRPENGSQGYFSFSEAGLL